ncbi:unnamed protein product [Symbiodinium natans]|uniref:Pentacotripeptide-repeat region of PRORP domain-containing protein n=1 Tax=Symbiodinium natans TaxID=878477 RepID=A0A812IAC9_9DINO|nr:unnamed protein product [Symbiodinium natans]
MALALCRLQIRQQRLYQCRLAQLCRISTFDLRKKRQSSEKLGLFNRMLGVCSAAGDFYGAERILQRVVKTSLEPDLLTFALVVAASAEARDVVRAELWLRRLSLSIYADAAGHPEVISSLMDAGATELARVAGQHGQQGQHAPQSGTADSTNNGNSTGEQTTDTRFSSLLHTLRKQWHLNDDDMAGFWRLWEEVLQEHRLHGLVPSRGTLHAMLQVLARCNRQEEIRVVLKDMASFGVHANSMTFGVLIDGASQRKDVRQAEAFFQQARQHLLEPTLPMLNSLLKGCAAAADLASAQKWFERIYSEGLAPNTLSFNSLLGACGTAGDDRQAESVLQDMVKAELRPDGYSYLAMIKANGHRSAKEAERWLSTAISARVTVDTGMFNAVIRAYVVHADPWEVKRVYSDMQRRDVTANAATFLSVAHAHAMEGEVSKTEDFIYAIREAGYRLGRDEYSCLLKAYSWKPNYRSHRAERLFREMISENIAPHGPMLRYLRLAMGEEPAQALIQELQVVDPEASSQEAPPAL